MPEPEDEPVRGELRDLPTGPHRWDGAAWQPWPPEEDEDEADTALYVEPSGP